MRPVPQLWTSSTLHLASGARSLSRDRTCRATKSGRASAGTRRSSSLALSLFLSSLACMRPAPLARATAEGRLELREVVVHETGIVGVVRRRPLHKTPERDQVVIAPVEGQVEEVLGQLRPVLLEEGLGRVLRAALPSARLVALGSHAVD